MKRTLTLLTLMLALAIPLGAQPNARRERVRRCLNVTFDGFEPMRMPAGMVPPDLVALAFMHRPQTINVNVQLAPDMATARAQYRHMGAEESSANGLSFRGVQLRGRPAQRTWYTNSHKSEVGMIVADRFDLRVSYEPAEAPDDVMQYAERIDIECLERAAR